MTNNKMALMIASAAAMMIAAPASAGGAKSVEVSYADLDLSTGKGQRTLKDRIRRAIVKVCDTGMRDAHAAREFHDCHLAVRAKAKPDVEAAIAAARSGTRMAGGGGKITLSSAVSE